MMCLMKLNFGGGQSYMMDNMHETIKAISVMVGSNGVMDIDEN